MKELSRRGFLNDVSQGMLLTGLGTALAAELGLNVSLAKEGPGRVLPFGKLRPLVTLLQETPVKKILPVLVKKLNDGQTTNKELVAAAALANAETFGGQDYVGYHTEMALLPALQMSAELPKERQSLPILKVIYRNSQRIQESGRAKKKMLLPIEALKLPSSSDGAKALREATRKGDIDKAEEIFAALASADLKEAYNDLLWSVEDDANVHRFVLAHRAYAMIPVVGKEHAHTLLRQSVRFCADEEKSRIARGRSESPLRRLIPKLMDKYRLVGRKAGSKDPGDAWVAKMVKTLYESKREDATDAVAGAIADGISPEVLGEAISLASTQLVLRQDRSGPAGWRVHGASMGVHASDAANAWRNMIRVSDDRNVIAGLLVAAYHTANRFPYKQEALPHEKHLKTIKSTDAKGLLREAEEAIRSNEQGNASAAIQIYGERGYPLRPALDLMLRYAISEDGRLHAEKYYRTVVEEMGTIRKAFRWQEMVGLARVTASAYGYSVDDKKGYRAPGYEEACELLKLKG